MKEGKGNVKPKGDIAEAAPEVISVAVSRVLSESDALSVVKTYDLKDYAGQILVTEDKNIFLHNYRNEGLSHAEKHNLKSFTIQWPV